MFTHRHADGGFYRYIGPQLGKRSDPVVPSDWIPGVCYADATGKLFWTDIDRWAERFEAIPEGRFHAEESFEVTSEEEPIACYTFRVDQVDDVRHLLISASRVAGRKRMPEVEQVLVAQADMIGKGLHVRSLDFEDLMGDVNAFHVHFKQIDQSTYGTPRILPNDLFDFRVKFHDEETTEYRDEQVKLVDACTRKDHREITNSLEIQLDSLCDAVWVLLGTADFQFGKAIFYEAWRRVVKANMAKVLGTEDPKATETGRDLKFDIRKPVGWTAPDHRDLVQDYLRDDGVMCVAQESNTFNAEKANG
jgi:predicted HAD superfamily Cof-like phosphohydrolase